MEETLTGVIANSRREGGGKEHPQLKLHLSPAPQRILPPHPASRMSQPPRKKRLWLQQVPWIVTSPPLGRTIRNRRQQKLHYMQTRPHKRPQHHNRSQRAFQVTRV